MGEQSFLDKNQKKKRKAWVDLRMIHATMMSLEAFVALSALLDALSSCVFVVT